MASPAHSAIVLIVSELAAAVGAIMAGPISDVYSRKYSISGWVVIFAIGVVIQTAGNYNVATIYGMSTGESVKRVRCSRDCSWTMVRRYGSRSPVDAGPNVRINTRRPNIADPPQVQRRTRSARNSWIIGRSATTCHHVRNSDFLLDRVRDQLYVLDSFFWPFKRFQGLTNRRHWWHYVPMQPRRYRHWPK